MSSHDVRTRQLQIALSAVDDGMLGCETFLRAVSLWLSQSSSDLCEVLLRQPELSDVSRHSIRSRFAEPTERTDTIKVETDRLTSNRPMERKELERLRAFLQSPSDDEAPISEPTESQMTVDFVVTGNLESPTEPFVAGTPSSSSAGRATSHEGQVEALGKFEIVGQHDSGGLGVVFMAKDQRLQRQVILKKMRPSIAQMREHREKFVLEAEVTGQLEHPGIVPIYGMGNDENREPFYVMRLIAGKNLRHVINDLHASRVIGSRFFDGLAFRETLQRFIDICQAIAYAHSRGVIHRDLKPANVMLGEHGETLVIDWGMAKILQPGRPGTSSNVDGANATSIQLSNDIDETVIGSFRGTLRYAAPEQLAGDIKQLGPASDLYSLGAILCEILCNKPALSGEKLNATEALGKIKSGKLLAPIEVDPSVPRPLNAICVKAMAIDITDRYASATELAAEVERWLADEAVIAYRHQESRFERIARWFRHHRGWAAGIALSLIALTASALVASYFINSARLSEQLARRQAVEFKEDAVSRYRVAKSALDTLMERSDGLLDIEGASAFREQLIQKAAQNYAALAKTQSNDPDLEIERARAMVRTADALMLRSDIDPNRRLTEVLQQYETILQMLSAGSVSSGNKPPAQSELVRNIELARTFARRAVTYWHGQKIAEARSDFATSISLLEKLHAQQASNAEVTGNLATTLLQSGSLEDEQNNVQESLRLAEQSVAAFQSLVPSEDRLFTLNLAKAHQLLERLLRKLDRRSDALSHLQLADGLLSELLTKETNDPELMEARASLWVSAASSARESGDSLKAIDQLQRALASYQQLTEKWGASASYEHGIALCHLDLAMVYAELKDTPSGGPHLEQAFSVLESLKGRFNANRLIADLAEISDTAGTYLAATRDQVDSDNAIAKFSEATKTAQDLAEVTPINSMERTQAELRLSRMLAHRGRHYLLRMDLANAKIDLEHAVELLKQPFNQQPTASIKRQMAHTLWTMALLNHESKMNDAATEQFQQVLSIWQQLITQERNPLDHYQLGRCYLDCPVEGQQNPRLAHEQAEICNRSIPEHPLFIQLLADSQAALGQTTQSNR